MGLFCGSGGCLWLPSPLRAVEGVFESVDPLTSRSASSISTAINSIRGEDEDTTTNVTAMPKKRGLTIILTLEQFSNVAQTTRWIQKHKKEIKNVLLGTPPTQKSSRRSRRSPTQQPPQPQPNWSSPGIATLFDALALLPNLERLLLYDIGTTDNPLPLAATLVKMLSHPRPCLDQVYIVGTFTGNHQDCVKLGQGITLQPKLTQFAWYGSGNTGNSGESTNNNDFTVDPILKAVASVPTISELHVQLQGSGHPVKVDNPRPTSCLPTTQTSLILSPQAMQAVGNMSQLTSLTVHNCDTNGNHSIYGNHLAILAKALEKSTSLTSLTVFDAFEGLNDPTTNSMANQRRLRDSAMPENEDINSTCRSNYDYQHKNHQELSLPQVATDCVGNSSSNSCEALYSLIRMSSSLENVQIWFGFSRQSDRNSRNNGERTSSILHKGSSNVLIPFAKALANNPHQKLKSFETALLWSNYDQDATAQAFVDVLSNSNTAINAKGHGTNANVSLQSLSLGSSNSKKTAHLNSDTYHGKWQWSLTFYLRLNQTGRQQIQERSESMTSREWIEEVLTTSVIPKSGVSSKQLALFRRQQEQQKNIHLLESSRPLCCPSRRRRHRCHHVDSDGELDDDDGADEDWFILSWIYYYLRQNPSMCYMNLDGAPTFRL